MTDSIIRGLKAVADHFGISERQARRWRAQGMPRLSGRRYDLLQIQAWRDSRDGKTPPAGGLLLAPPNQPALTAEAGKDFQDARLKKYKADLAEMTVRQRRRELVERAEVEALFVTRIMAVKQGLLSLPRSLPPQLAICRSEREMEPVITRAVKDLLEIFARPLPDHLGADPGQVAQGADELQTLMI